MNELTWVKLKDDSKASETGDYKLRFRNGSEYFVHRIGGYPISYHPAGEVTHYAGPIDITIKEPEPELKLPEGWKTITDMKYGDLWCIGIRQYSVDGSIPTFISIRRPTRAEVVVVANAMVRAVCTESDWQQAFQAAAKFAEAYYEEEEN